MERLASSRLSRATSSARRSGPRRVAWLEVRERRFDVQRDRRESLRQRVMHIAGNPRSLVRAGALDRLLAEARPLDRDADLVRDRRQQIQLLPREPPPAAHREVHDAERTIGGIQRHARVTAQAVRQRRLPRFDRGRQPAALDDVDVPRRQLAAAKQLETPARAAGHAHRLLQIRRQVLHRSAVEAVRRRIAQPDPAGLDTEEIGDAAERLARYSLFGRRAVERFGDFLEYPQRARLREAVVAPLVRILDYCVYFLPRPRPPLLPRPLR